MTIQKKILKIVSVPEASPDFFRTAAWRPLPVCEARRTQRAVRAHVAGDVQSALQAAVAVRRFIVAISSNASSGDLFNNGVLGKSGFDGAVNWRNDKVFTIVHVIFAWGC